MNSNSLNNSPVIDTDHGPVRGARDQGLSVFKAIPYAAAPIGARRWQPPQPPTTWTEPLGATQFGPAAPQTPDELELDPDTPQSEDCLTLNVWTPHTDLARRPVMVWIHGGGFSWGTARNDLYDGSQFAKRGDVVVVTIQYRLGALGWLDLKPLGHTGSPNNGLLDQIAALKWVHNNIAAFGGDPDDVTIAGESAGAISIGALMASPQAAGLFHRAILQSGSPGLIANESWSAQVTEAFMKCAHANSIEDLRQLTTEQILSAQERFFKTQYSDTAFHPVIDGQTILGAPIQSLAARTEPTVPTLIGTTLDEARYWILYDDYLDRLPASYFKPWLDAITNNRADSIFHTYVQSHPTSSDGQIGLTITGDAAFRMPAIRTAEVLAKSDTPVWMYLFTLASTRLDGRLGSPHAIELPFMFNNVGASGASDFIDSDAFDYQPLADKIQNAWINFIRDGNPYTPDLGEWPTYNSTTRPTMIFGHEPKLEHDPFAATREIWNDIPFDGLTPSIGDINPTTHPATRIRPSHVAAIVRPHVRSAAGTVGAALALVMAVVTLRNRRNR